MAKFKVLKEFVLNGIVQKVDSIIELDKLRASLKSIQANIEKAPDNVAPINNSVLDSLKAGETLSPEQKEKLAKENIAETVEAQRLAAEHRARDIQSGHAEPPVQTIANLLKDKLENEQFQSNPPQDDKASV